MPILTLKISANAQIKDANTFAKNLTALSAQILHKRADVTSVLFQRMALNDWWIGCETTSLVLMQLDICITQGTNSEAEKALFISQAFELLPRYLADGQAMHPTCYVRVQEIAATDWGYAGVTQATRRSLV